ncbi:thiosulfate/3-mercaptopyruvate sulfurtransferase 1, mitochondrial-like isoform X2 [Zingiber officinale]|uniref:thiosulfate/3-mercaptopyruvate sulfurtransferase 1, mitochondrial-like isoform X2 n=1 Tax=Zingiber officinale TaxID=94328 RepID=UPI001C4B1475|nr:thiosulfate/3-mercaptopyruvate sulfurtransferase 1, mitochondrial-like isoform X2 [Zingiber officinale]
METREPIVSAEWLHSNLANSDIKVLDASWYMPQEKRNPLEEYQVAHIPGAVFFDIDQISDPTTDLPHMLPLEEAFAAAVSVLGIQNTDSVIIYDGKGLFSAPRVWWTFRIFGHNKVWVLNGGLPHWLKAGYEVEATTPENVTLRATAVRKAIKSIYHGQYVKQNMTDKTHQLLDARSKGRFDGVAPEPREGIKSGHIPESKCVPFTEMVDSSSLLLPEDELHKKFSQAGVSLDNPIVASCGSGMTACILCVGLHRLGKLDVPVYDGSWTEWATQPGNPIHTLATD